jgi:hypothetical protein
VTPLFDLPVGKAELAQNLDEVPEIRLLSKGMRQSNVARPRGFEPLTF